MKGSIIERRLWDRSCFSGSVLHLSSILINEEQILYPLMTFLCSFFILTNLYAFYWIFKTIYQSIYESEFFYAFIYLCVNRNFLSLITIFLFFQWSINVYRLKSWLADQYTLIECDWMSFVIQYSPFYCPYNTSIGVAVLWTHW